jgi:hypothetical protein
MNATAHSVISVLVLIAAASTGHTQTNESAAGTAAGRGIAWVGSNQVSITVSGGQRVIQANGLPDHTAGQFPRRGNPNRITAQQYHFRVSLKPQVSDRPTPVRGTVFGIALNGVPFDPGTAEFWKGDPNWTYEAKSGFIDLGLDENNAHVQPNGAYHYHGSPKGLIAKLLGEGTRMVLIGYAADGFPIYNGLGHTDPMDIRTPLKKVRPSYQLKPGLRQGGPGGKFDGKFVSDYGYVARLGDLDECNGRLGVTSEYPQGIYHYYVTDQFPYIPRFWRGTPDPSFEKQGSETPRGRETPPPARPAPK